MYRSVIAAESLKKILKKQQSDQNYFIDSYGLQGTQGTDLPKHKHLSDYPTEWSVAKPILQKLDIDISKHSFQKISETAIKKANVIIAMDDKVYSIAKNSLMNQFPNYIKKIHCFSELTMHNEVIPDPFENSDVKLHRKIIRDIYSTLDKNFKKILCWIK